MTQNEATICPKCGFTQPGGPECRRCGLIYAKYQRSRQPAHSVTFEPQAATADGGVPLLDLLLPPAREASRYILCFRGLLLLLLAIWGARLALAGSASNAAGESLLHLVNLPFHEAGHVLCRPFGQFVTSLGGTLGQLLTPLACLLVLLLQSRDPFGAAVCLWWFGENLLDIAPYIRDARAGALPLLGGNFGHSSPYGFHDWEYLLTETGLLRHDHLLASLAQFAGALLMALALVWGGALLLRSLKRN